MNKIPFEIPELPIRKIDEINGHNATVVLMDNSEIKGFGNCILPLPVDPKDDDSENDDFLDFQLNNGKSEFLRDSDIKEYKINN